MKVGATRGDGPDVKSHVRLVGHPDALSAFVDEGWVTERVSRTCQVGAPNADCDVLGAVAGSAPAVNLQFCERIAKLRALHSALAEVNDPATELTLGRACADVCRSVHLLRTAGHDVSEDALKEHDEELNSFVCRALGGDLRAGPLDQAALSVSQGGLGFRRAVGLALPAFISSRVEARPYVEHIFASMASAGVEVPGALAYYDRQTDAAWTEFKTQLSSDRASLATERLGRARDVAAEQFAAVQRGERDRPTGAPVGVGQAADLVVPEFGADDPEHPSSASSRRPRLQRSLTIILDEQRLDDSGVNGRDNVDSRRTHELVHGSVSSEWMWALDPIQPDHVEADAYVAAVRLRLGASFSSSPLRCRVCNGRLDEHGVHATCCAPGESTRGHNEVRDAVFDLARLADQTSEKETLGLLDTAPGLRPADVLTSAVSPGRVSALDVGIAAVEALNAGVDCAESMRLRKRQAYSRHLPALEAEGIEDRPLVWSCWGWEHPDTTAVLTMLARQAARRRGLPSHKPLLQKTRAQVGAALARRSAAMLRACTPAAF